MPFSRWLSLAACLFLAASSTAAADLHGDPLPAGAVARLGTVRLRHNCLGLAFAPDGKTFATAGGDRIVRVWVTASGREVLQLTGHSSLVSAVAFTGDGKQLVSACLDGTLRLWETAGGKLLHSFGNGKPEQAVVALTVAPSRHTVITTDRDGTVRVWGLASGKELRTVTEYRNQKVRIALSPDGKHFAAADKSGAVAVWDAAAGKEVSNLVSGHKAISLLAYTPDGKSLAVAGTEPLVSLWDVQTGQPLRRFEGSGGPLTVLAFSPNGRYLAGKGAGPLRLWGLASGKELRTIDLPMSAVHSLAFSPDGKVLAIGDVQTVHLWDMAKNRDLHDFPGHAGTVEELRFSADSKMLTTTGRDRSAHVWDPATGKRLRSWQCPIALPTPVTIAPDGSLLVTDGTGVVRIEWAAGQFLERVLIGSKQFLHCLGVSPDGKLLAAKGIGGQPIALYSTETGKLVRQLEGSEDNHLKLAFAPDGKMIAAGGQDVDVLLWETATGKAVRRWKVVGRTERAVFRGVTGLVFTPDGKGLLMLDVQATLWELATGSKRWRADVPNIGFRHAAFAPDGNAVVLGSSSGTVHVVETFTGAEVGRLAGHRGAAGVLAFAPDGKTFVSGSDDGTALVWDAAVCRKAVPALAPLKPEQSAGLWRDLAGDDVGLACKAMRSLVAAPAQAVPMLQAGLQGGAKDDRARFAALVRKLDAKAFAAREAAQKELEAWEDLPLAWVLKEAEENTSVEVRARLKRLADGWKEVAPDAKRLRALRTLETLEHIGTKEARAAALKTLAETAPEAWLKQEAQASLARLQARP